MYLGFALNVAHHDAVVRAYDEILVNRQLRMLPRRSS
jgi:hypothetical protein